MINLWQVKNLNTLGIRSAILRRNIEVDGTRSSRSEKMLREVTMKREINTPITAPSAGFGMLEEVSFGS